ncbi:YheC/YheD family protein [Paenibacillus farraposensis]|uniref:YheC/YheD family protein n=1 Tax=Paenibacillus farraposensis TaxID=2807095 RepID=A0ABW4DGX4_9BACL|nr:YheC/YheD family protein [Paenibacillus farraposensis]MCC3379568.1 YheC/YheD family protein [Paenibacillus farraposensis]
MASATKDKWYKYLLLRRHASLRSYVPETKLLNRYHFSELLSKYRHVMVKPVWGSRGRGIFQVSRIGRHKYIVHYENIRVLVRGRTNTYHYIRRKIGNASYMVQRRITRPTINNRPFDMRVIIQRRTDSSVWVVTGKVIKVAGKGYIVSNNTRSKGTLLHFKPGIRQSSIWHLSARKLESDIDRVSIRSAKRLSAFFPGHRMYGLDIALDPKGRIGIIEANLYPAMSHFRKLKDKTMYYRIADYKNG